MKKLFLVFCLFIIGVNGVQAQRNYDYYDVWDVLVGGKVGGSMGLLTKQPCDPLWGPYGSIEAEMYLNKKLSMTLEMSAAHKGGDNVFTPEGSSFSYYQYRMDYLNTSYIINYHFIRQHVSVYTGLTLGRLINAKSMKNSKSVDIMDEVHKGDFSVPVGIEWTIGKHFTIDGRWHWSPRWIAKTQKAKDILHKSRHQFFSLTVGYKMQVF